MALDMLKTVILIGGPSKGITHINHKSRANSLDCFVLRMFFFSLCDIQFSSKCGRGTSIYREAVVIYTSPYGSKTVE